MNKLYLIFALIIFFPLSSFSQGRLKGGKFIQAGLGFRGAGPNASLYGGLTFSPMIKGMVGGGIGTGKVHDIRYTYVFLDGIGSFNMKSVNRIFYLNGQAGVSLNGDLKNKFESETYKNQFSFNYGVLAGLEAEFFASRTLMFVLAANERYYIKKDFGSWRFQVSASVRVTF